jgi:hypothetical protein
MPSFILYVIVFVLVVVVSGALAKNAFPRKRYQSFHPLGFKSGLSMLFLSVISIYFSFIFVPENVRLGIVLNITIFVYAEITFHFSIMNMAVIGQRRSLRYSINLKGDFFRQSRKKWEDELKGYPNSKQLLESLDEGNYITEFFDQGSFDIAVLWSCSLISNAVNTVTETIIAKYPEKESLFRKKKINDKGDTYVEFERTPVQLENLGFSAQTITNRNGEKFNLQVLWQIRNDIAHRNELPTFFVTIEALRFLVTFANELPNICQHNSIC